MDIRLVILSYTCFFHFTCARACVHLFPRSEHSYTINPSCARLQYIALLRQQKTLTLLRYDGISPHTRCRFYLFFPFPFRFANIQAHMHSCTCVCDSSCTSPLPTTYMAGFLCKHVRYMQFVDYNAHVWTCLDYTLYLSNEIFQVKVFIKKYSRRFFLENFQT